MTFQSRTFFSSFKAKTIWIIPTFVIIAAAGGYGYYTKVVQPDQTTGNSNVQASIVRRGDLVLSASGSGTLISPSDATFGFETSGQITQINIKVGDQVQAGQALAHLDDTLAQMKYEEAQQELQELYSAASMATIQKQIATAQDAEFQARTWLEYLISPEVVKAEEKAASAEQKLADAQAEAKANPSDIANQNVQESQAAATYWQQKLDQARTYYKNVYGPENFGEYENIGSRRHPKQVLATYIDPHTGEVLPKIDWPSADDMAKARNEYAQAQQTIKDGETYLEVLKAGVIPQNATGDNLTTLYNTQLALNNAKAALDATTLVAPIDGIVTSLNFAVGEEASTSSTITISQLSQPYTLDTYLDETAWNMAKVGNKASITFNLLPQQTFTGTVTLVYPELTSSFNAPSVHILVKLDQSISQSLPAGTGAGISVIGGDANNALLVPVAAIQKIDGKPVVYIIQNGQQVQRQIITGLTNDSFVEVKSGLQAGDVVVTK